MHHESFQRTLAGQRSRLGGSRVGPREDKRWDLETTGGPGRGRGRGIRMHAENK